ncbi:MULTISPECIES: alpha-amylase family glycosyl hydrolase [Gracilibacillus]|uniref:alpha-amylase family glycosyl hydrolase n=1 Tax=Gracilibacillus TaxID=74385 RepID=UPI0008257510|nr:MULTISPECIES: alpha-amylase family glycosyl hydrolase [Gracilibacillus]
MQYIKRACMMTCFLFLIFPFISTEAAEQADERIYYMLIDRYNNGDNDNDIDIDIDDSDAYHGGDLQGIIDKMDDLSDLGITMINLSPVMEAESYHGFDITSAQSVNPHFGDIAILQELVSEAQERDMRVILDFPLSHVSSEHNWNDEQMDWVQETTENTLGEHLPTVDMSNQDVQEYLMETAIYWLQTSNVDGFHFYVNQQTPDDFIEELNQRLQAEKEDVTVIYDGDNDQNDMNNTFQSAAVDALKQPGESITPILEQDLSGIHFIESVNTPRFAFESVQEGYNPVTRWKLAATLLYTLPGSSLFYQGVEVPMDNGADEPDHRMAELNKTDEELTEHLDRLSNFRGDSSALQQGELEVVAESGAMTVFKRSSSEQTMYVAINNDTETQTVALNDVEDDMQLRGILDDDIVRQQDDGSYRMILDRETSNIFVLEDDSGLNWFFLSLVAVIFGGFVFFVVALNRKGKQAEK